MTLDLIIKDATEQFNALPANVRGYKVFTKNVLTEAGKLTVTLTQQRSRSFHGNSDYKVTTQLKLNDKIIAKKALLLALGETSKSAENPVLKAAFLARAPELAADYAAFIRETFKRVNEKYPNGVPSYVSTNEPFHMSIVYTLRSVTKDKKVMCADGYNYKYFLVLDEKFLLEKAAQYGERTALEWFRKTNEKLGDVQNVDLGEPFRGEMVVIAERDGKKIVLNQQRILKHSPRGLLFHQFPARIYVDKQFTTEAAYKKMFKAPV